MTYLLGYGLMGLWVAWMLRQSLWVGVSTTNQTTNKKLDYVAMALSVLVMALIWPLHVAMALIVMDTTLIERRYTQMIFGKANKRATRPDEVEVHLN